MSYSLSHVLSLAAVATLLASMGACGQSAAPSDEGSPVGASEPAATPDADSVRASTTHLAIPFQGNAGQWPAEVAFKASVRTGDLWATRDGAIVHALRGPAVPSATSLSDPSVPPLPPPVERAPGWSIVERFADARPQGAPEGRIPGTANVSYFWGSDETRWAPQVATFDELSYGEPWPGIRAVLRAQAANVEKLFFVSPGADPSRIRVHLEGALGLRVSASGALVVSTGHGDVEFSAPYAYQKAGTGGARKQIHAHYTVSGSDYDFDVGSYDRGSELVIDPVLQATYLGAAGIDSDLGDVAFHPTTGEVYVTGFTDAATGTFPGTTGGYQSAYAGSTRDCFVTRFNPALTAVLQSTYIGTASLDSCIGITLHPGTGDVYVTGFTTNTAWPGVAGSFQPTNGGGTNDVFVTRLSSTLTTLTKSTYIGGSGGDVTYGRVMVHPLNGNLYLGGWSTGVLPGTAGGAFPTYRGGANDGFLVAFNTTLTTRIQATMVGGAGNDVPRGAVVMHPVTGDVYIAGQTSGSFPSTTGGGQATHGGGTNDVFIARFNSGLTALSQATYFGGVNNDAYTHALAIHPTTYDIYIAGSTPGGVPGTTGGAQALMGGGASDAFVARFNSTLTTLSQATYLGGTGNDDVPATALMVHPTTGEVYVAGVSSGGFPFTTGGAQATFGGGTNDAFVVRLAPSLTTVNQGTYFGGAGNESVASSVQLHSSGYLYVNGYSAGSLSNTAGGAQSTYGGGTNDVFVARMTDDLKPACGNGIVDSGETCDDGNATAGDGCSAACAVESGYSCPRISSLSNGDLEQPTVTAGAVITYGTASTLGAWTVTAGDVDMINSPAVSWIPQTGAQCMDLSGSSAGSISQTVPTVVGRSYAWEMRLASNTGGGPAWKTGLITASSATPAQWQFASSAAATSAAWEVRSGRFVAGATSTTFAVRSLTAGAYGPTIDAVRLYDLTDLACATTCGNGYVEGAEGCDDGNGIAGDGCSSTCALEAGANCSAPANLLANGSFESPVTAASSWTAFGGTSVPGWTIPTNNQVVIDSTGYASRIPAAGNQFLDTSGFYPADISQAVTLTAGTTYVWSARIASPGGARAGVMSLNAGNGANKSYLVNTSTTSASSAWDTVGGRFIATGTSGSWDVQGLAITNNGLEVDDVKITTVQNCACDGNYLTGTSRECGAAAPICLPTGGCSVDLTAACP